MRRGIRPGLRAAGRGPTRVLLAAGLLALGGAGATMGCGARTGIPLGNEEDQETPAVCGDGRVEGTEACDDGNQSNTDGCLVDCRLSGCGDGILADFEGCDDGNTVNGDGCTSECVLDTCGDGIVDAGEECDDPGSPDMACTMFCRFNQCGDGVLHVNVEECDAGPDNADRPAILVTQGKLRRPLRPVEIAIGVAAFYDYRSASAHTGFEAAEMSRVFFTLQTGVDALSMVSLHGIDNDDSGVVQPEADVFQILSGLPSGWFIMLVDDNPNEFFEDGDSSAVGDWDFRQNTDGGAISGLPFPGSWSIDVESYFDKGIFAWQTVDGDASGLIDLDAGPGVVATFTAFPDAGPCRLSCTIPRCGDGFLDGGEVCDDGNTSGGDVCSADCSFTSVSL